MLVNEFWRADMACLISMFGFTVGLALTTQFSAIIIESAIVVGLFPESNQNPSHNARNEITTKALLLCPWWQWTKTFPPLSISLPIVSVMLLKFDHKSVNQFKYIRMSTKIASNRAFNSKSPIEFLFKERLSSISSFR